MAKSYIDNMLGENEKIILVTRQHGFVLFSSIIAEILVTLVVIAAFVALTLSNPVAAFGFLLALVPVGIMIWDIMNWNNHQYVVTNRRVIQIVGILNKSVIDSSLEKVTDIKMTQTFFGRLFDYGDVEILTASDIGVNLFRRIGNPIRFKTAMLNAKEKLGYEGTGARSHNHRPDSIPALIAALEELRKQGILTEEEFREKKKELLAKM